MARAFESARFDQTYEEFICRGQFQEEPSYYPRYRSRYKLLIQQYARLAPPDPCDVLDIGGGQLALLCHKLWQDRATAADIGGPHLQYLREQGIQTAQWNLCSDQQPFTQQFDFAFFSEVIEHLPIPGHIVLERIRLALKPGGTLICSTPNFYRLRNVVYVAMGKRIFDYFRMPEDRGLGHVLEYSRDHLAWQFERAGFKNTRVEFHQMHHQPTKLLFRVMSWLGYPLFLVPRFRDNLVAFGNAP